MKVSEKPARKCHACPFNMGRHCWLYKYPRGQWRNSRHCGARDDVELLAAMRDWEGASSVKTRKDLRRESHRHRRLSEAGEGRDWLSKRMRS